MAVDGRHQFELVEKMGFVRMSGTEEERRAAQILVDEIEAMGVSADTRTFEVKDGTVIKAVFEVIAPERKEYTVTGYKCAGCTKEGGEDYDFIYIEQFDEINLRNARGKFALINGRASADVYRKMLDAGVAGFMTMGGTVKDTLEDSDLDTRKMRETLTQHGLMPAFHIRMTDALEILKSGATRVHIELKTKNHVHISQNVVAEIKGTKYPDEIVAFGAHYDSVEFSYGVWDNAAGSVTIMEILRHFTKNPPARTVRFIWFGSEEVGLLGSHAYVDSLTNAEAAKHVFMVNCDVGGSILGSNGAHITADESLCKYVEYMAKELGYSTSVRQGVMSSDSVPFADRGIPAINFARGGGQGMGFMHTRYDMISLISAEALAVVTDFAVAFSDRLVNAVIFPVPREIPKNIKDELDKYLGRTPQKN